jgi:hypothetical protein
MLGYLSKFVLQMLPTISATVIGAYIVSTWINPKAPPDRTRISAQSQPPAKAPPAASEPEVVAAPVAEKSAETAEPAKPVKAASGADNIRIIPIVKERAPVADALASAPTTVPAPEAAAVAERKEKEKDANELARAAIQRLRGGAETARVAEEPAKPAAVAPRVQQVRAAPELPQPLPAVVSAPPLPPAVTITAPKYPQDDSADRAAPGQSDRLAPPGEIPAARAPLNLQATHRVAENPSLADDFLSATKSFFRAITP